MLKKRVPSGGKEIKVLTPPICKLCINAWTMAQGKFHTAKGCAFCKRIREIWSRMSPEERQLSLLPDVSFLPAEVAISRHVPTVIYKRRDKHLTTSKQLEDAIY